MADSKRGNILERWFPRKEAEQKADELKTAADALDAAGVKRKEISETKALDLGQLADEIIALAASGGDPAAIREQLVAVLGQLVAMDGSEQQEKPVEEEPMAMGMMEFAKSIKGVVDLNDTLIKTQEDITKGQDDITKAQKEIAEVVKTLADVPKAITALVDRVKAVENQLAGRPKAASTAKETTVTDDDVIAAVKAQALEKDNFWGVPMYPKGNS